VFSNIKTSPDFKLLIAVSNFSPLVSGMKVTFFPKSSDNFSATAFKLFEALSSSVLIFPK